MSGIHSRNESGQQVMSSRSEKASFVVFSSNLKLAPDAIIASNVAAVADGYDL